VTAAASVVFGTMVCAKAKEAKKSKPQKSSEVFRVFFMVFVSGAAKRYTNTVRERLSFLGSQQPDGGVVLVEIAEAANGVEAVDLQAVVGIPSLDEAHRDSSGLVFGL